MSYQQDNLRNIADAIRVKKGTEDPVKPIDFADEILAIDSGGIPVNDIIRAMDLSRALADDTVVMTETDYEDENIEIMTDFMEENVGGI